MKSRYAITGEGIAIVSSSVEEIVKEANTLKRKKRKCEIYRDGQLIGWIGEDLTQREGWGLFIDPAEID